MRKKKMNPRNLIISIALFAVFLIFLGGVMAWEYLDNDEVEQTTPQTRPTVAPIESVETVPTSIPVETILREFDARRINFLLVGRDWHGEGENGRSDTMILCSVDTGAKTVKMVSFLRDIYLKIPGHGSSRLNAAYSWGGPNLLIDTIELNFRIKIDKYVVVDFTAFEKAVDLLGGVDVELTEGEANAVSRELHEPIGYGMQHLNGRQALMYSRIRYLDNDFMRTSRQRKVINEIIKKAKTMDLSTMLALADEILPMVSTNLTNSEILVYLSRAIPMLKNEVTQRMLPVENEGGNSYYGMIFVGGREMYRVDFANNIKALHQFINS